MFERLGLRPRPTGWRSWALWRPHVGLAVAACAVVLAFAVGAVVGHTTVKASTPGHRLAASGVEDAALWSGPKVVGRVEVYAGNPTWLFMTMDAPDWQGTLRCEVVVDQARPIVLGQFWLSGGKGAWAASVDQPAGRLSEARIVGSDGAVLATAHLS